MAQKKSILINRDFASEVSVERTVKHCNQFRVHFEQKNVCIFGLMCCVCECVYIDIEMVLFSAKRSRDNQKQKHYKYSLKVW